MDLGRRAVDELLYRPELPPDTADPHLVQRAEAHWIVNVVSCELVNETRIDTQIDWFVEVDDADPGAALLVIRPNIPSQWFVLLGIDDLRGVLVGTVAIKDQEVARLNPFPLPSNRLFRSPEPHSVGLEGTIRVLPKLICRHAIDDGPLKVLECRLIPVRRLEYSRTIVGHVLRFPSSVRSL